MGFTVTRPGGAKDVEFPGYAGLLHKQGMDLGKLPRVRDPITDSRWLPVWNERSQAEAFAHQLQEQTGNATWEVVEVDGPVLEGPLGPVVIQMVRQAGKTTFALSLPSRALIRSAFPRAVSHIASATIETGNDVRKTKSDLRDAARMVVPRLTGLGPAQLRTLGYCVVDADSGETLVSVPPAEADQTGESGDS